MADNHVKPAKATINIAASEADEWMDDDIDLGFNQPLHPVGHTAAGGSTGCYTSSPDHESAKRLRLFQRDDYDEKVTRPGDTYKHSTMEENSKRGSAKRKADAANKADADNSMMWADPYRSIHR